VQVKGRSVQSAIAQLLAGLILNILLHFCKSSHLSVKKNPDQPERAQSDDRWADEYAGSEDGGQRSVQHTL